MSRPYVGILVDSRIYKAIPSGKTGFERISFYEEAGIVHECIPCFFQLRDIVLEKDQVQAYVKGKNNLYTKQHIPIPKVIHNRAFTKSNRNKYKLQQVLEKGIIIFNEQTRYRKLQIHELLSEDSMLQSYLPFTLRATEENILHMLGQYDTLIIKPNNGSLGHGVMKMTKVKDRYEWMFLDKGTKTYKSILFNNKLPTELTNILKKRMYIVQQRIPLACYQGHPFDLRVSVQKNGTGNWQVTGIVGKVAGKNLYVTNVARGGTVQPLQVLLANKNLILEEVCSEVENISLKVAERLSSKLNGLADIGLDIGITEQGFPMFIECNCRDLRYAFRNAKMIKTWKNTYMTPIAYARYLLDKQPI